jgi:hypothetical protein
LRYKPVGLRHNKDQILDENKFYKNNHVENLFPKVPGFRVITSQKRKTYYMTRYKSIMERRFENEEIL